MGLSGLFLSLPNENAGDLSCRRPNYAVSLWKEAWLKQSNQHTKEKDMNS